MMMNETPSSRSHLSFVLFVFLLKEWWSFGSNGFSDFDESLSPAEVSFWTTEKYKFKPFFFALILNGAQIRLRICNKTQRKRNKDPFNWNIHQRMQDNAANDAVNTKQEEWEKESQLELMCIWGDGWMDGNICLLRISQVINIKHGEQWNAATLSSFFLSRLPHL